MSLNALDLSRLPAPNIIAPLDHAAKVAEMKAQLVAALPQLAPVLELASEPLVKLLETWAYELVLKTNEINATARAVLLPLATGANLDNVAANLAVARKEGESDAAFRARAALGPEGWSTAGPKGAYLFHALSASPLVADADVQKPEPGKVRVVILSSAEDGVADEALLNTVEAALSADEVRPFTDNVEVVSATVASYDVTATLRVLPGPDAGPLLALAEAAIQAYAAERRRLNRAVTLNGIVAALMRPGVEDLVLLSPTDDIDAAETVAPVLGEVTLDIEVMG